MADVKISALPAATTPLAGTEVLPIVQSSTTKKVAISDVTAGRAISASSLTLTTPLAVGSGGTGLASLTAGYIPFGAGTSAFGNSADLFWNNSVSRLGIGTNSPSERLHVNSISGSSFLLISSSTNNMYFGYDAVSGLQSLQSNTGLYFATGASYTEAMRIASDGSVGIGITNPTAKLAVSDGTRTGVINPRSSASGSGLSVGTDVASTGYVLNLAGDITGGGTGGGVNVSYYSSASGVWNAALSIRNTASAYSNLLLMQDGGNVGIGTSSPSYKLDVFGVIRTYDSGSSTSGYLFAGTNIVNVESSGTNPLAFRTNSGESARIDSSGNLLVGTTSSPTSGTQCLTIETGTAATASPADTVTFYSTDRSAGNTIPSVYCEGSGVTDAGITSTTVTHKIAMRVNGTVYYLLATTNAT